MSGICLSITIISKQVNGLNSFLAQRPLSVYPALYMAMQVPVKIRILLSGAFAKL